MGELHTSPELSVSYLGFDVTRPPFDDPLVRRAFPIGADRQRVLDTVLESRFSLADGLLSLGLPSHDADLSPIDFDPDEARALLADPSSVRIDPETGTTTLFTPKLVVEEVLDSQGQSSLAAAQQLDPDAQMGDLVDVEVSIIYIEAGVVHLQ